MDNTLKRAITETVAKVHSNFMQMAAESDESLAYQFTYKTIILMAQEFRLMNIINALRDNPTLLKWFQAAYKRSDRIMYNEYLESRNNA